MEKIKHLILLLIFSFIIQAQEHIYIPMAVILEDNSEKVMQQMEMEKEAENLFIEQNKKPIIEEKKGINSFYDEKEQKSKKKKIVKVEKKSNEKTKVKKIKEKKESNIEKYAKLKLKGGITLGTTAKIDSRTEDAKLGMGFGGGAEYFRNLGMMRNIEYGLGGEVYLLSWDNIAGVDEASNPGVPGIMSIPIYLTVKYVLPYDIYIGGRGGLHMLTKAGNLIEAANGIYYGLEIGKRFKQFGIELVYSKRTGTMIEGDINTGYVAPAEGEDPNPREAVDFSTAGLGLNFYYLLNF